MRNMTLLIDPDTRDLVFDAHGMLKTISGSDTTLQNVRHTLLTWVGEFFADTGHGTDYPEIFGMTGNIDIEEERVEEIIRQAIFQEPDVSRIDTISATFDQRNVTVEFSGVLSNGETIDMEVIA